jgi:tetratricopeptide (TPR) repeat protein
LYNGLGRYDAALAAVRDAGERPDEIGSPTWAVAELIEAAVRQEDHTLAHRGLTRLAETTRASGTEFALGIEARSRALLSDGDAAESLYREAIERLQRTRLRVDLARSHLLYGEWLRRERRRVDARERLRTAFEMFTGMGVEAFTGRAERELLATGEQVRKRSVETRDELTAQEAQIARTLLPTTCAKCSPSSTSPRAANSTGHFPTTPRPRGSRRERSRDNPTQAGQAQRSVRAMRADR